MTMLGQRRQMVVPLADGWCWANNVGPTLGHCDTMFVESYPNIGWGDIVGPTLDQRKKICHESHPYIKLRRRCWVNVGTIAIKCLMNHKRILVEGTLFGQRLANIQT